MRADAPLPCGGHRRYNGPMPSFWDERYSAPGYAYGVEPNDFLRAEAGRIPHGRVLCLAEGQGRNAVWLAGQGYDVVAVDASRAGLDKAEALARERGVSVRFEHADLATWEPEPGAFTGVVAIFAHLPEAVRRVALARACAALVPGGVLLLESYRPEQVGYGTGGPKDPAMLPPRAVLEGELGAGGLEIVASRDVEREVQEGAFHTGLAATLQIIARRAGSR